MTEASKILSLIETVEPNDASKLDEIDCLIECWLQRKKFVSWPHKIHWPAIRDRKAYVGSYNNMATVDDPDCAKVVVYKSYSRSRDALKSIRPDGWDVTHIMKYGHVAGLIMWKSGITDKKGRDLWSAGLPSEELAELHAVIQAIEYERSQK